ncbi:MAG: GYD domain-containing protein [Kiritimatiellae bacterium]|nr:GYD domain-containing protein [Kiritimatiellia bacterium]
MTFFMFGKYSTQAIREIDAARTLKAINLIKAFGGSVKEMYALLGPHDLVFIVDLPGVQEAMKASVALTKQTGIGFSTAPAMTVEQFDKLIVQA